MNTTPGPWFKSTKRRWRTASRTGPYIHDADGRLIADLARSGPKDGTSEGDANLIAAAPRLLEIAERLVLVLDGSNHVELLADARAVISAARGGS